MIYIFAFLKEVFSLATTLEANRVYNFNPGPSTLPLEVLKEAQAEFLNFQNTGMSILEISHRAKAYDAVHNQAKADILELMGLGDDYEVLFVQAYFMHFVKRYKLAFRMKGRIGRLYEKWLDHRFTSRHVPHKFLVKVHDGYSAVRNKLKDFLVNFMPGLYLKLRMIKHHRRADKNA